MADLIGGIIVFLIVASAITYIKKQSKKGIHCIGCSNGGKCAQCAKEAEKCNA